MTDPQHKPGDLVRVVASTFHTSGTAKIFAGDMVGEICAVKSVGNQCAVWKPNKSDYFWFNFSDLEPFTPPDKIEQHGVTYVRKDLVVADTARLDWLLLYGEDVKQYLPSKWTTGHQYVVMCGGDDNLGSGDTARAAIDAAMRAEQAEAEHAPATGGAP